MTNRAEACTRCENLRRRAERLLNWEDGASRPFSFPALCEAVRGKSSKLHYLMREEIRLGTHVFEEQK